MLDKNSETIKTMFNELAPKYDWMNTLISFCLHKIIKQKSVNLIPIPLESKCLDLCCGTGDIADMLAQKNNVENVLGLDFSTKMLEIANHKQHSEKIIFQEGDCTNIPCKDEYFNICTIAFGLRNIKDYQKSITEINRVLKKDGYFLHLDIFKGNWLVNWIFDKAAYLLACIFSKNPNSYKYLIESKNDFFSPNELILEIEKFEFSCVKKKTWLFGMISAQLFCKK